MGKLAWCVTFGLVLGAVGLQWSSAEAETLSSPTRMVHVSPKGDDAWEGTEERPLRTIRRAAEFLQPGDVCIVHAGVYRETVKPANSGEAGKAIVFRTKEGAIVTGADPIEGLSHQGEGRFAATMDQPVEQLFVDGRMLLEARWPNMTDPMDSEWAKAGAGTDEKGIVDPNLPDLNYSGATVIVLPGSQWVTWTRPVLGFDAGSRALRIDVSWKQSDAYRLKEGSRYYVFGSPALLDAPWEWCYDANEKTVTVMLPIGTDIRRTTVEAKRRERAFDLRERQHIVVEGFRIFAATVDLDKAEDCVVTDCHLRYASHFRTTDAWKIPDSGIILGGKNNKVTRSSVVYSAGNGVTLRGENNELSDCRIQYVNYMATDCGAVFADGRGHTIAHNTMSDAGRSILLHRTLKAGRILRNNLYNAGLLTTDLGITYCFGTDGDGTEIAYNWVHDNKARHIGVGIYIDNGSKNFLIHHNVSWNNPDSGIRLNTPSHNNRVYHNTVVRNGNSLSYWGPNDDRDWTGCEIANNIFTDKVETGHGARIEHNFADPEAGFAAVGEVEFALGEASPCVDAGTPIEGLTSEVVGAAPDFGAYERGVEPWTPGHTWGDPPAFTSADASAEAR